MELKGTVLNVVDFGAFVDIGLKDSGLVHISQLANRYIKSPHDVVSVGDVVTVWVMGVDQERKRVSLTMVKPGTERQRGRPARRRAARRERAAPRGSGAGPGPEGPSPRPAAQRLRADVAAGRRRLDRRAGRAAGAGGPIATAASAAADRADRTATPGPAREGARDRAAVPRSFGAEVRPRPGTRAVEGPAAGTSGTVRGRAAGQAGPGPARSARGSRPRSGPAPPSRPSRPSPPPPPLSKEALTGSVPLRTFGQLKQLWEARVEPGDEPQASPPRTRPAAGSPGRARGSPASTLAAPESSETAASLLPTRLAGRATSVSHRNGRRSGPRDHCAGDLAQDGQGWPPG